MRPLYFLLIETGAQKSIDRFAGIFPHPIIPDRGRLRPRVRIERIQSRCTFRYHRRAGRPAAAPGYTFRESGYCSEKFTVTSVCTSIGDPFRM